MTDMELTKACAAATEYKIDSVVGDCCYHYNANGSACKYDPLHDDAQVMALVKKFRLSVEPYTYGRWNVANGNEPRLPVSGTIEATDKDLNRAIVECVAKLGALR